MAAIVSPILLDVPTEIETERLMLRLPRPGESQVYDQAARESAGELHPWFGWAHPLQSIDQTEVFLRESAAKFILRQFFLFMIWRKADQKYLGSTTLHSLNWSVPKAEIGYWLRTSETGHGYMTDVVKALSQYGFQHLHLERIEIWCDARNGASARVAERAGFRLEAVVRHAGRDVEGQLKDDLRYVLFPPEQNL